MSQNGDIVLYDNGEEILVMPANREAEIVRTYFTEAHEETPADNMSAPYKGTREPFEYDRYAGNDFRLSTRNRVERFG